jgi:hypothetical protein
MRAALAFALILSSALAGSPQSLPPDATVESERARDDETYAGEYGWQREILFHQHAGEWAAIAGGELLAPFATLEACVAEADKRHPKALHRYVFRIGEDGEVRYQVSVMFVEGQPRNIAGNSFRACFHIASEYGGGTETIRWMKGERVKTFEWKNPSHVDGFTVCDPSGIRARTIGLTDSTGSNHWLALEAGVARDLHLETFEIPGRAVITGGVNEGSFRRAHVRVRIPELDLDDVVPAFVWPR